MKKLIALFFSIPTLGCIVAVFLLTGAETALLVGFLVPGEVTAILGGVIASHGRVPLAAVLAAAIAGACCGDSIGYFAGRKAGSGMFGKRRKKWSEARAFLRRGGTAVLLGRFTPFIRTIMPAAAGAAKMPYRRFLPWNAAGGILWGASSTLVGYWGGRNAEVIVHRAGLAGLGLLLVVLVVLAILWKRFEKTRLRKRRRAPGARDPRGGGTRRR